MAQIVSVMICGGVWVATWSDVKFCYVRNLCRLCGNDLTELVCVCCCVNGNMETENNYDSVQLFNVRLSYYLTRISRTCVLIRKHKENLQISGDFSFPVQLKCWLKYLQNCVNCKDSFISVPFMPKLAATNPKTILEYSYINRVSVAGDETVCDDAEWVRQKVSSPSKYTNHRRKLQFCEEFVCLS